LAAQRRCADPCGVIKRGWKLPVFIEEESSPAKKDDFTSKQIRIKHRQNSANVTGQSECITIHHQPDGE
jgi:hypothetical protein